MPIWVSLIVGIAGFLFVGYLVSSVLRYPEGIERVREISGAIKEGALASLHREYRVLILFVVIVAIVLAVIPYLGWKVSIAFIFGALCSMGAGYLGMNIAIRSNSRTATAS